jgi:WD40 repeat protein
VHDNEVLVPYKQFVVEPGDVGIMESSRVLELPAGPAQVIVGSRGGFACVLDPSGSEPKHDILYFGRPLFFMVDGPDAIVLHGHTDAPWRFLISPNNLRAVSCADDGSIRLWDLDRLGTIRNRLGPPHNEDRFGKEIAKFPGYTRDSRGDVRGEFVAFSPDGRWLVTAVDGKVSFRNPDDGSELFTWSVHTDDSRRVMAIRFDDEGNHLFAFLENSRPTEKSVVKFLEYNIDDRMAKNFEGVHGVVDGRATVDGKYVITWDGSSDVVFWDAAKRKEIDVIKASPEHVYDVAFSPKGDVIASAGNDGEIKFWRVADRIRLETVHPYKHESVDFVQFRSTGKLIFTGSDDGWLKCWGAPEFTWDKTVN